MEFINDRPTVDLTYSDVFLVPSRSNVQSRLDVDLTPGDGTPARMPLVASNMNSVTGPRLAAAMARRGGLAVLPQDLPLQDLDAAIRWVKAQPVLWDTPVVMAEGQTADDALRVIPALAGVGVVVVRDVDAPLSGDNVRGVVTGSRLAGVLGDAALGDLVGKAAPSIDSEDVTDARHAFDLVHDTGAEVLLVRDKHGVVVGTTSERSALRSSIYPAAVDGDGRLAVAAAVGINGDAAQKAAALAAAGVDVIVLDTAHGHQDGMVRAIDAVASAGLGLPIVAGNIVTANAARDLINAGATILKVGVGPGAMCTTRMMTAVGRPQFSAVLETAELARSMGAYVWADGGVRYPRDVALALAAGASSIMIGSWFAGTIESPGELLRDEQGRVYKESWGMASTKAVQARFGKLDAYDRARKELFAEGISSSTIYIDTLRPSVEDLLDMITSGVRSSFTYAGARTVAEFHERARVGLQSAAGYEEGKPVPVSW